ALARVGPGADGAETSRRAQVAEGDLHRLRQARPVLPRPRRGGLRARARGRGRDGLLLRALRRDALRDRVPLPAGREVPGRAALVIAPLVCLDPGHGTPPAIGREVEPSGPGPPETTSKAV